MKRKEYLKEWEKKNKEKRRIYKKLWKQENKKHIKIYSKQWRINNKDKIKKYDKSSNRIKTRKEYNIKYPERLKAYNFVHQHQQKDNKCSNCDSVEDLQFHHIDYINNKGFTLCRSCHIKLHIGGENKCNEIV